MATIEQPTVLRLFVSGSLGRSDNALAALKRWCDEQMPGAYELSVIDVLEDPQQAENEKIIVTPTLIKDLPPPHRRIIGDISDPGQVLVGLHLV